MYDLCVASNHLKVIPIIEWQQLMNKFVLLAGESLVGNTALALNLVRRLRSAEAHHVGGDEELITTFLHKYISSLISEGCKGRTRGATMCKFNGQHKKSQNLFLIRTNTLIQTHDLLSKLRSLNLLVNFNCLYQKYSLRHVYDILPKRRTFICKYL